MSERGGLARSALVGLAWATLASACASTHDATPPPSPPPRATSDAAPREVAQTTTNDRSPSAEAYRSVLDAELKQLAGDTAGALLDLREATLYDPESAFLRRRAAELHLELGEIDEALRAVDEALVRAPRDVPAHIVKARVLRITGARDDARRLLDDALALAPGDRAASTLLAELFVEDGRVDDAARVLTNLMESEPAAIDGFLTLAALHAETGDLSRALDAVERALERDARSEDALDQKITLLESAGRFVEAVPVVHALLRETGDSKSARHKLLVALVLAERIEEAERLVDAWLTDDSSEAMIGIVASAYETAGDRTRAIATLDRLLRPSERLAIERGRLLFDDGRAKEAAPSLCAPRAASSGDGSFQAYVDATCARALIATGDAKGAAEHVARARESQRDAWRLLDVLALLARTEGSGVTDAHFDDAMTRARADRPTDVDLVDVEVRALSRRGRADLARRTLDEALRARPKDDALLVVYAHFLESQGDGRGAAAIVRDLLDRSSHRGAEVSKLNFLAFTLADHGLDAELALRLAWRAVLRDPLNGYVVDTLGWAQRNAGQLKEARATLARAARLSPGEAEIAYHQGVVEQALGDAARARAFLDDARARATDDEARLIARIDAARASLRTR